MATRRTLARKPTPLCPVTGPRGGKDRVISIRPEGLLAIGMTEFKPEELNDRIKDRGERRRIRRALFQKGFRGAAVKSLPTAIRAHTKAFIRSFRHLDE